MKPLILLLLISFGLGISPSRADIINPYIEVKCMPELNVMFIRRGAVNSQFAQKAITQNADMLLKKYGIIDLYSTLEFGPDNAWQKSKKVKTQCHLQTTSRDGRKPRPFVLELIIEGYAGNQKPDGECGSSRSALITIKSDEQVYIDDVLLDEHCQSPRSIGRIEVNPEDQFIGISTYHNVEANLFWLNKGPFKTITHETIYPQHDVEPNDGESGSGEMVWFYDAVRNSDWKQAAENSSRRGVSSKKNKEMHDRMMKAYAESLEKTRN